MTIDRARVKIPFEGKTVDAIEIGFTEEQASAGRYALSDGAVIELKHTVSAIYRLCDQMKSDGTPIYIVNGNAAMSTTASKNGKKDEER